MQLYRYGLWFKCGHRALVWGSICSVLCNTVSLKLMITTEPDFLFSLTTGDGSRKADTDNQTMWTSDGPYNCIMSVFTHLAGISKWSKKYLVRLSGECRATQKMTNNLPHSLLQIDGVLQRGLNDMLLYAYIGNFFFVRIHANTQVH